LDHLHRLQVFRPTVAQNIGHGKAQPFLVAFDRQEIGPPFFDDGPTFRPQAAIWLGFLQPLSIPAQISSKTATKGYRRPPGSRGSGMSAKSSRRLGTTGRLALMLMTSVPGMMIDRSLPLYYTSPRTGKPWPHAALNYATPWAVYHGFASPWP
ncbi:MAG: hypothetical protein QXN56_06355, partial [Candidatus Hadarchaeum sp.]